MTTGILLDGGCKAIGAFQCRLQGLCVHDRLVGHLGGLFGPLGAQAAIRGDVFGPWQVTVDAPRFAELFVG